MLKKIEFSFRFIKNQEGFPYLKKKLSSEGSNLSYRCTWLISLQMQEHIEIIGLSSHGSTLCLSMGWQN